MRFKSRTRALVGSALAATIGLAGLTIAAPSASAVEPTRVAGADRYATAGEAARVGFCSPDVSDVCTSDVGTVVIANGLNFPDALAAASLGYPILLVANDAVPQATLDALDDIDVDNDGTDFYVVGGTGVVSSSVVGELTDAGNFFQDRLAGTNRIETALDIAHEDCSDDSVFLTNAFGFADALAAGPGAFDDSVPILLTAPDALSDGVYDYLLDCDVDQVVILGGTAAVSQDVEDALSLFRVTRVAGLDRYETARKVADLFIADNDMVNVSDFETFTDEFELSASPASIATGADFPDALAGGPFAGEMGGVLLLTPPNALGDDADDFIDDNAPATTYLLGGTAALSAQVADDVDAATASAALAGVVWDTTPSTAVMADKADGSALGPIDITTGWTAYTVDGTASNQVAFTTALTVGDTITISGTTLALTNGSATAGIVGQIDTVAGTFEIVTAGNNTYEGSSTYDVLDGTVFTVDGGATSDTGFLEEISVGDNLVVTDGPDVGTTADDNFALTNGTLTGLTTGKGTFGGPDPDTFRINALGDIPETAVDDYFEPDGTDQVFTIDGAGATFTDFNAANDDADTVSYSRTGDVETFALTNAPTPPPASAADQSFHGITHVQVGIDGALDVISGGTSFSVGADGSGADLEANGPLTVTIDGAPFTVAAAEAAIAPGVDDIAPFGHDVVFTDGDTSGTLAITSTTTTPALVLDEETTSNDNVANDGFDIEVNDDNVNTSDFDTGVDYSSSPTATITYHVNGAVVEYTEFEDYLLDLDSEDNEFMDRMVIVVTPSVTEYHMTTNNTLTGTP